MPVDPEEDLYEYHYHDEEEEDEEEGDPSMTLYILGGICVFFCIFYKIS